MYPQPRRRERNWGQTRISSFQRTYRAAEHSSTIACVETMIFESDPNYAPRSLRQASMAESMNTPTCARWSDAAMYSVAGSAAPTQPSVCQCPDPFSGGRSPVGGYGYGPTYQYGSAYESSPGECPTPTVRRL